MILKGCYLYPNGHAKQCIEPLGLKDPLGQSVQDDCPCTEYVPESHKVIVPFNSHSKPAGQGVQIVEP